MLRLTQGELAAAMGVTQQLVSHIETGRFALSIDSAIKLLDAAKKRKVSLTLDYLYRRDDGLGPRKPAAMRPSAAILKPSGN